MTMTVVERTSEIVEDKMADHVDGRFCNETISYTLKTDCKPCTMNAELGCPDGLIQLTQVLSPASIGNSVYVANIFFSEQNSLRFNFLRHVNNGAVSYTHLTLPTKRIV